MPRSAKKEQPLSDEATKILTIDDILAVDDLPEATLELSEWGGAIKIRALTRGEIKRAYRMATRKGELDADEAEKLLVCWATVDPVISPATFEKLSAKNAGPVGKLLSAIMGLSGVDDQALEKARANFRD